MSKLVIAAALSAAMALMVSSAEAFPVSASLAESSDNIIQVRGGCGLGWHRGPWGGCRRNAVRYGSYAYAPYAGCWWRPTRWGPERVCSW
jgi:hypothetical protein